MSNEERIRKKADKMAKRDARIPIIIVNLVVFITFFQVAMWFGSHGSVIENQAMYWIIATSGIGVAVACSWVTWKIIYNKYYPIHLQRLLGENIEM